MIEYSTISPVDSVLLPEKPIIYVAFYAYEIIYIKWVVKNNDFGFDPNQITITYLRYNNSGLIGTVNQSK